MQLHIATRAICTYLKNLFTFGTVLHMQNRNRILFTFYLFFSLLAKINVFCIFSPKNLHSSKIFRTFAQFLE